MNTKKYTKHYVQFIYPGILFTNDSTQEIPKRDPSAFEIDENCLGYRFFDRFEIVIDNEKLLGERKNFSGTHYFGIEKTLDEIKREKPDSILLENMKINNWDKIVQTKGGKCFPLYEKDTVKEDRSK